MTNKKTRKKRTSKQETETTLISSTDEGFKCLEPIVPKEVKPKKETTAEKEKNWPQVILVRRATNGRMVSRTYRCKKLEIQEERLSVIEGSLEGTDRHLFITAANVEEIIP